MSASDELVLAELRGATCVLTLNQPAKRNALITETYGEMSVHLDQVLANPQVANVVLTGAGDFFCSGGDLLSLETRAALPLAEREERIEHLHALVRKLKFFPKPVIAAIEGGAAGAGASLVFAADLVVAAAGSYISLAYVKAGLVPDGGGSGFLALSLPHQLAAEIALLGGRLPVERFAAVGVVNRVVAPGEALSEALALGATLAEGARDAQAKILGLLDAPHREAFELQLEHEKRAISEALGGAEAAAGITAFKQKRAPRFPLPSAEQG